LNFQRPAALITLFLHHLGLRKLSTMYYESPQRQTRRLRRPPESNSSVLKPKPVSPVRKLKRRQTFKSFVFPGAWVATTNESAKKGLRQREINDENKENVNAGLRRMRTTLQISRVNGSTLTKNLVPFELGMKVRETRLPLRELSPNGSFDPLRLNIDRAEITVVS
jgi:hypothetical protein